MSDSSRAGALERLTPALYAAALLIIVTAVMDAISNAWPFAPGVTQWRYGAIGLTSNFLLTLTLGVLVACATAAWRGYGRTLRVFGVLLLFAALALVIAAVTFALDALTLMRLVTPDDTTQFRVGAVKAVAKMLGTAILFGWLGAAGWRAGRAAREAAKLHSDAAPLIGVSEAQGRAR
jgi:hypothetical protein